MSLFGDTDEDGQGNRFIMVEDRETFPNPADMNDGDHPTYEGWLSNLFEGRGTKSFLALMEIESMAFIESFEAREFWKVQNLEIERVLSKLVLAEFLRRKNDDSKILKEGRNDKWSLRNWSN